MNKVKHTSLLIVIFISACTKNNDKFIGEWNNPKMQGRDFEHLSIAKNGEDFLVEFTRKVRVDQYVYTQEGQFKEVGRLVGNSIEINPQTRISFINDGEKLLMRGIEFIKGEKLTDIQIDSIAASKQAHRAMEEQAQMQDSANGGAMKESKASATSDNINGVISELHPAGNAFMTITIKISDGSLRYLQLENKNRTYPWDKIKVGSEIKAIGQWMDDEKESFEPSSITVVK